MTLSLEADRSYEDFYREHADRFTAFLAHALGRSREGGGGRVDVADTLQEAMLRTLEHWPELEQIADAERDRRVYRYLRDAAGEALRREHGRVAPRHQRAHVIAFDFGQLHVSEDAPSSREQELTASVLGAMAGDLAASAQASARREVLDRAVLLAGLRALGEREAVVFIAVDYLERDQDELAAELGLGFGALRSTLFEARRVFYGVVRHAAGIELDEEERARLHAYRAGELVGRERRVARRHLQSCASCQALVRETTRFGERAQSILAPLPFLAGAGALVGRTPPKAGAATGGGVGGGLLGQPGAAKALAATVGVLTLGVGAGGWLAEGRDPIDRAVLEVPSGLIVKTALVKVAARAPSPSRGKATTRASRPARAKRRASQATNQTSTIAPIQATAAPPPPPAVEAVTPTPAASKSAPPAGSSSSNGGGEFLGQ